MEKLRVEESQKSGEITDRQVAEAFRVNKQTKFFSRNDVTMFCFIGAGLRNIRTCSAR